MGFDIRALMGIAGWVLYLSLAGTALWGAYCVIVAWRRVAQTRFRSEAAQADLLDRVENHLEAGDFQAAAALCDGDLRAVPQLIHLGIINRDLGYSKVRQLLADRFQRDVLSDLEHRLSWVQTIIRSAPMVGLLGTVVGMMGAFSNLERGDKLEPAHLAGDISLALITTACGLAIAIPLVLCTATINIRIRQLEELVGYGLTRFLESLKTALARDATRPSQRER